MSDFSDDIDVETPVYLLYEDEDDGEIKPTPDVDDIEETTSELADNYIGAEVLLPVGGQQMSGTVKQRMCGQDEDLHGKAHVNPILDTRTYKVEFTDGSMAEYSANVIAENMWAQCDLEGNQHLLMDSIVGYRMNAQAVSITD